MPTLWFIYLIVTTCHIQYTFLSLCQFFHKKTDKTWKHLKSTIFVWYENGNWRLLGTQSINPFNPKLIMQVLPTIQEENDWVM